MSRAFQSFWAELNVARLNHQSVLDVFICMPLSASQIKKEEKEVWAWPLFTSYWMFHLFKSYTSPFTSLPDSLSFYFSLIAFSPHCLSSFSCEFISHLLCVCVFFSVFFCVSVMLSLCGTEECVCCRSSVSEMWGECRQVWGIACESASAHRSD